MARKPKTIITCAVTGAIHTPTMSEALPWTCDQIAEQAIAAAEAGASILHLHARNPETGAPSIKPDDFAPFLARIKQATDAVVNISTGGSLTATIQERIAPAKTFSPEMCSMNMGSLNFSFHGLAARYKEWKFDWEKDYVAGSEGNIFRNTFKDIKEAAETLAPHRIKFEHEIYDVGHLYTLAHFVDRGLVKPPFFVQMIFGILGGIVGGRLLARLLDTLSLPVGTYPVMTLAGALFIFAGVSLLGGSGFLAAYLAGISLKAKLNRPIDRIVDFNEAFQWLCQLVLFLTLGLLVTPSALLQDIWPTIAIAAVLMLVARPLAVFISVGWMGFTLRENVFLSWVGLRGAVPILLAIYPVISPGPITVGFFNVVFVIVAISLTTQGWTIGPMARLLGLGHQPSKKEDSSGPSA